MYVVSLILTGVIAVAVVASAGFLAWCLRRDK